MIEIELNINLFSHLKLQALWASWRPKIKINGSLMYTEISSLMFIRIFHVRISPQRSLNNFNRLLLIVCQSSAKRE